MRIVKNKIQIIFIIVTVYFSAFGQNVIRVHDPVAIKSEGKYHIFCTGLGIGHYVSEDMKNWQKADPVFPTKPEWANNVVPEFKNHIWAPDILYYNDQYYLFYSVSAFAKNTSAIGVVTNKTLNSSCSEYKWKDHGIVIQSQPNRDLWNAIDPNLIIDSTGTPWMCFGSFWQGLKMVKLSEDLLSIAEPQEWHTIARRTRSINLPDSDPGDAALEAPFIFKKDNYYYLFISWDLCCRGPESTYKVVVGRSTSATGPFMDKEGKSMFDGGGSLVVQGDEDWYGAGHCSVYNIDDMDIMFFHAYDAHDEGHSKLKIVDLEWDVNGWPLEIKNY